MYGLICRRNFSVINLMTVSDLLFYYYLLRSYPSYDPITNVS
jgi:hypothetical protein